MSALKTVAALTIVGAWWLAITVSVEAQQGLFKSGVELVPLTVTVTNKQGQYVNDLTDRDFRVFEEGVPQSLSFFTGDRVPIDLAIVLDVSGSMVNHMRLIRKAATGLVEGLHENDRAAIAAIKRYVELPQPLTSDMTKVLGAINGLSASGSTALYDGVYLALKELERWRRPGEATKQVIVVLSDGLDTSSHIAAEEVSAAATALGVNIYVIAAPTPLAEDPAPPAAGRAAYRMRLLARDSGGRLFAPTLLEELPAVCAAIAHELDNQYVLAYVPERRAPARGFRRVTVQVANAVARTRAGYFVSARP
jgi:Ca-activated chloride channel family protein